MTDRVEPGRDKTIKIIFLENFLNFFKIVQVSLSSDFGWQIAPMELFVNILNIRVGNVIQNTECFLVANLPFLLNFFVDCSRRNS